MSKTKPPIVLLTDFGLSDAYVGIMKGVLARLAPGAAVIDLTHGIEPQNVAHAAWTLSCSWRYFPPGSIFVCVVDPGVGTRRPLLVLEAGGCYFLAPDNGLLSPLMQDRFRLRILSNSRYYLSKKISRTFHGRDILAPAAAHLWRSRVFAKLGPAGTAKAGSALPAPVVSKSGIQGQILFFDHFGNAISNIPRQAAAETQWKRARVYLKRRLIGSLQSTYGTARKKAAALWNSSDYLEIACPGGSARNLLKMKQGETVRIRF